MSPDVAEALAEAGAPDPINPSHYTQGGIEVADAIEAWGLDTDAWLAQVVQYVARCYRKGDTLTDLRKARWFLDRRIARLVAAKP